MKERLTIMYLPPPADYDDCWQRDIIEGVGAEHELRVCAYAAPVAPQFRDVDIVLDHGGSMGTREMADAARSVRLWQILGTGFDHFDLDYWRQKKIPVANCPGQFSAVALAECAIMFMLLLARRWNEVQFNLRQGERNMPLGLELNDRRLGLVGFGTSARELARRARVFGMKIAAVDILDILPDEQREYGLEFAGKPEDLDRMISDSDYVSLHLHLNAQTRHIMDAGRLRLMKPTACLINVARGALVDEDALYETLLEGRLGGAGLDVFTAEPVDPSHRLLRLPNVVAMPHLSGATDGTSRRRAACAAMNIDRIASGLEPLYRIDT